MTSQNNSPKKSQRRLKSEAKKAKLTFGDFRFIQRRLSRDEKDDFLQRLSNNEFNYEHLDAFVRQGYKVSFKFNEKQDSFNCTVIASNADSVNAGLMLSSFAEDVFTALSLCTYKHTVLAENGDWSTLEDGEVDFFQRFG